MHSSLIFKSWIYHLGASELDGFCRFSLSGALNHTVIPNWPLHGRAKLLTDEHNLVESPLKILFIIFRI